MILEYKPGELPVGPPADHKLSHEVRYRELREAGYQLAQRFETHEFHDFEVWRPEPSADGAALAGRDLTQLVRPPRAAFVNFPMGNPLGRPGDVATQRAILLETLRLAERRGESGLLVDLPHDWGEPVDTIMDSAARAS